MAKQKPKPSIPNKHLHSRISFLQQAAKYLTLQQNNTNSEGQPLLKPKDNSGESKPLSGTQKLTTARNNNAITTTGSEVRTGQLINEPENGGLPLYLSSHLFQVARKSQIRLHPDIKHSICKLCSSVLVEGKTSRKFIENVSQGGKKPHADVLVVECEVCGMKKRWPVGARRQSKKGKRNAAREDEAKEGKGGEEQTMKSESMMNEG